MSKGLEALDKINKTFRYVNYDDEGYKYVEPYKMLDECDEEFNIIEKHLKALEIISKKEVDLRKLSVLFHYFRSDRAEDYNKDEEYKERYLTEEEFELLKEVLESE